MPDRLPSNVSGLFDLTGRKALVTGGTSGIGLGIASALQGMGAQVVVSSDQQEACNRTKEAGMDAICLRLGTKDASEALLEQTMSCLGAAPDILVSNAGIEGPADAQDEAAYEALFNVNLHAAVWLAEAVAPEMARNGGGAMLFTASIAGLRGNGGIGPYGLTKAALSQLVRNLAVKWGPSGVRANAIAPGLIDTDFSAKLAENQRFMDRRMAATPLRRMGTVEEVAAAAVWLAGPGGAFTTGQTIVIDGGTLISDGS